MKWIIVVFFSLSIIACATEDTRVSKLLAVAATSRGNDYRAARDNILVLGTNALPALALSATDANLTWQQRLVARICYERIARSSDIQALRSYDWSKDPGYRKEWERYITGAGFKMDTIVIPKCRDMGLWHYYIELTWKETGEALTTFAEDRRIQDWWPGWCIAAVADTPERYWYPKVVSERMWISPFSRWHINCYRKFIKEKDPETVPVLIKSFDAYVANATGMAVTPTAQEEGYRDVFVPILAFADLRHADLLEKFILDKPSLTPLRERLAEVRARPAPAFKNEPSFRLGTNLVVIAP